jgi:hypothetical protein
MYRDVLLNLRPRGTDFICEVQITLTGIAILKKSEQKIYSIMRMASPEALLETYVFSNRTDPSADETQYAQVRSIPGLALQNVDEEKMLPLASAEASTTASAFPSKEVEPVDMKEVVFESLIEEANDLRAALRERDGQIAELRARLAAEQRGESQQAPGGTDTYANGTLISPRTTATHCRRDFFSCSACVNDREGVLPDP